MRILIPVFLISLPLLVCAQEGRVLDRTIAKLNDDILTESDLSEVIADVSGQFNSRNVSAFQRATSETVQGMFDRALLLQEARRLKIQPSSDEMNRQVESMVREIRANFSSETEFHQALASERISLNQLKQELLEKSKTDFQVFQVINSRYSVADHEVQSFETQKQGEGKPSVSFRLRRLGIEIQKKEGSEAASRKARDVVSTIITEGISFEEGIRKYSQVPGAAGDAGDMGYMSADKLNAEIYRAVEKLEIGQASAPIVAGGFANVFYVEGKRGAKSAVRERKFFEAREQLLKELQRKANLQIFDDRLRELMPESYQATARSNSAAVAGKPDEIRPPSENRLPADAIHSAVTPSPSITPSVTPQASPQPRGVRRWFGGNRQ